MLALSNVEVYVHSAQATSWRLRRRRDADAIAHSL